MRYLSLRFVEENEGKIFSAEKIISEQVLNNFRPGKSEIILDVIDELEYQLNHRKDN